MSDDKFPILLAWRSIIQPENNGNDDSTFNRHVTALGGNEAPAAYGMAGGLVEAFEIAAFFEVDRNRMPIGADLDPEQHFPLFAQATGKGREGGRRILEVGGIEMGGREHCWRGCHATLDDRLGWCGRGRGVGRNEEGSRGSYIFGWHREDGPRHFLLAFALGRVGCRRRAGLNSRRLRDLIDQMNHDFVYRRQLMPPNRHVAGPRQDQQVQGDGH